MKPVVPTNVFENIVRPTDQLVQVSDETEINAGHVRERFQPFVRHVNQALNAVSK